MRNWRKTALKSDHGDILQSRKEKNASLPIEDTLEHGNGDDPIDDLMTDLASYFEQKMQEDMEAVQREMKDVEIPPDLRRKMENTIYRSQTKTSFFRNKRRMRALSAACALFLTVGLGAGVLISPQSGDLRDALYELISDNDGTEAENGLPGRDEEDSFVSGENEADENMNSSELRRRKMSRFPKVSLKKTDILLPERKKTACIFMLRTENLIIYMKLAEVPD